MNTTPGLSYDVLIIGSGIAGLSLALRLAEKHQVTALSKGPVNEGLTFYAQGGIAATSDEADSIDSHVENTLIAGAGLCGRHAIRFVASNARTYVQRLIDQGVLPDTQVQPDGKEGYHLTRGDGHDHRRILRAVDAIDKGVETILVSRAQNHPNIRVLERSNIVDLIVSDKIDLPETRRVVGAWIWNRNKEAVETCHARSMVLITDGVSKVYQYTINLDIFSGDGIAMAWCTGCRVANLEFDQFHPTALYHPQAHNFLLTETLCGEGTRLKRPNGSRLMPNLSERGELTLHGTVARAIGHGMKRLNADYMFLDISHKPEEFVRQHFPTIYEKLLGLGTDLTKKPVPIMPVAHYTYGGVVVDDFGRTDVDGLYTVDGVSYTSLHDVNRMVSNSLLKCLVYGWSATEDISRCMPYARGASAPPGWDKSRVENPDELVVIQYNWHELRLPMWGYVDTVRMTKRLERTLRRIIMLQREIDEYYAHFRVSNDLLELRNLVQAAELIVRYAMICKENRGLHYTLGYPEQLPEASPSIFLSLSHYINR